MEDREKKRIQWHPGFVTGINLELGGYNSGIVQEREYNLNTKPLAIDVLLRKDQRGKKADPETTDNEIARIFRRYNIVEYKSPDAHLDMNTYFKANSYACLLKVYGYKGEAINETEITISFVRHAKPKRLLACFKKMGMEVLNPNPGIYYIVGKNLFPLQIVVTRELDLEKHTWLVALSGRLGKEQLRRILEKAEGLKDEREKELADSVLQVCIAANRKTVEELKGEENMCQALREIMKPELEQSRKEGIEEGIKEGIKEGMEKGICVAVSILRSLGQTEESIRESIMENYKLSQDAAEKYMEV